MNFKLVISYVFVALAASYSITVIAADNGRPAPSCQLTSLDKSRHFDLQQFKGKVVYVDFWASWCGPCAKSFPFMNTLHKDLESKGLQVLAINLDENTEDAQNFLTKLSPNFPIVLDAAQQCAQDFEVKAMPTSFLIDRNGVIRETHLGFRPGEAEEFRVSVERLLAEPVASK